MKPLRSFNSQDNKQWNPLTSYDSRDKENLKKRLYHLQREIEADLWEDMVSIYNKKHISFFKKGFLFTKNGIS